MRHEGIGERTVGKQQKQPLPPGRRHGHRHPVRAASRCAPNWEHALHQRQHERQDQREMPPFDDHGCTFRSISCSGIAPLACSASATSGGM